MTTLKHRHHHNNYDLYGDLEKIKEAFADAAIDVKGKAGQILTDSVEDIRKKSAIVKDNVAEFTAEKPFKTLGLTLLAGIAIGYFLHR